MIHHFMHEILIGSSQYFTSYYIESRHLCEILKSEGLGWAVQKDRSAEVEVDSMHCLTELEVDQPS